MSQATPLQVIEVSPDAVEGFDPATGQRVRAADIPSIASTLKVKEAVLAFSRRSAFVRAIRVPDAGKGEVAQVLALQAAQVLPAAGGELAYDFRLTGDRTPDGRLAIIGAVRSELLRGVLASARASGIKVCAALPAAFGSWALAKSLGLPSTVVVEQTSEGLAIDVVIEGELRYSRLAPIPRSQQEIGDEVSRTLAAAGLAPVPVLAAGGLSYDKAQHHTETRTLEALAAEALHADLDIEPPEAKAERARAKAATRARIAALLSAGAAILFTLAFLDYSAAAAAKDRAERRWKTRIRLAIAERKAAQAKLTREKSVQSGLRVAFQPAQRFSDMIKVASNSAPEGAWLTGITAERGKPLALRGTARTSDVVAMYLDRLAAQSRFRDVSLSNASNSLIETTPVVQFALIAWPVGNLPLLEQKRGASR